jgi:hypothetical protein
MPMPASSPSAPVSAPHRFERLADPGRTVVRDSGGNTVATFTDGHHRFISSRQRANGPTAGDLGGRSLLDDGGHHANGFRTARRI